MKNGLLTLSDPAPFEVINKQSGSNILFLLQHSGQAIPAALDISDDGEPINNHTSWDIGTMGVGRHLAKISGCTTIIANYSRLVIDINRSLDSAYLIPSHAESIEIAGNANISDTERRQRIDEIYHPYHEEVKRQLARISQSEQTPVVIDIHSFTRRFFAAKRPWNIGLLWGRDQRIVSLLQLKYEKDGYVVGDNQPYDLSVLCECTLPKQIDSKRYPNALIEFSNDLIDSDDKAKKEAEKLWMNLGFGEAISSLNLYNGDGKIHYDQLAADVYLTNLAEAAKKGQIL